MHQRRGTVCTYRGFPAFGLSLRSTILDPLFIGGQFSASDYRLYTKVFEALVPRACSFSFFESLRTPLNFPVLGRWG